MNHIVDDQVNNPVDNHIPAQGPEPAELARHDKQVNFRISTEDWTVICEVAEELDFRPTTLCRRIVKQFVREHLAKKAATEATVAG